MKLILLFVCFIVAVNALDKEFVEEFMAKILAIGETCSEEVGATADDIAQLMAHTVPDSHTGKCMIFCFYKHFHIQREDGSVDRVGALKALDPLKAADAAMYKLAIEVFVACGTKVVPDSDPCITAANMAQCAIEEGKARGFDDSILG